jgi:transketolase
MTRPIASYEDALLALVKADARIVVMTAENRAAIRGLPEKIGNRFIDVGIAEQTMIGAAAGLALRGRVPVAHALATFLTLRAFEFIRTDVGIPALPVKLVGSFAGFTSEANGPTHQAIEDVALMRGVPAIKVFCPADLDDMLLGLASVVHDPSPWYIRYNDRPAVVHHTCDFRPGKAEVLSEGSDVCLITYGTLFTECYRAAELVRSRGLSVGLINVRSLKPVDEEALVRAARSSALLVTAEDHLKQGGLYSILAELLYSRGLAVPTLALALDGRWFRPALMEEVIEVEGFTAEAIAAQVVETLNP